MNKKNGRYSLRRETICLLSTAGLARVRGGGAGLVVPPQGPNTENTATDIELVCTGGGTNRGGIQTDGFGECVM